jgi:hypothetical protein
MPEPGTNREIRHSVLNDQWEYRNGPNHEWRGLEIQAMSKMELCKACGIKFPKADYPGRVWPHYTTQEMVTALTTGVCPEPKQLKIKDEDAPATDKQKQYIRKLNAQVPFPDRMTIPSDMTMGQASETIQRLQDRLAKNKVPEIEPIPNPIPSWTKPVPLESDPELERRVASVEKAVLSNDADISHLNEKVSAVASLINDLRPQVTEIHIPAHEPVRIEGRQHKQFDKLVRLLGEGLNVFLVGPPGTGKSHMCEQAAIALGLNFGSEPCDPSMSPTALFGYRDANGNLNRTPYMDSFDHGGVFLLDEMDKCHPGVLSKINGGIANKVSGFPDGMHRAHADWRVVAAANTWGNGAIKGHESAMSLDKATKNRFVKLFVGYDEVLELELALAQYNDPKVHDWVMIVRKYRKAAMELGIIEYFTPRNSIDGARMLRAGFTMDEVKEMSIVADLSTESARKLADLV